MGPRRRALAPADLGGVVARIAAADQLHAQHYPGTPAGHWQPVQTLYVPADRVDADIVRATGSAATTLLARHVDDVGHFARLFTLAPDIAERVHDRVGNRLRRAPVDDLRIDFEDGYGSRGDAGEDTDAVRAAEAVDRLDRAASLPRRWGLRVKSFGGGLHARSIATLDLFLGTLLERRGDLPAGFVVTFPKIAAAAHVGAFVDVLDRLEDALALTPGSLRFEVQIETPESVIDHDGVVTVRRLLEQGGGRLAAAHVGVFDYTAALGIPPEEQRLDHPALDFARHALQVALAGTGVELSDGSTNVAPADPDDRGAVHRAWRAHAAHVRHSIRHGYRQGWDLHPAHLVSRYATVYGFYLDGMDAVLARLDAWESRAAAGDTLDEPATIAAAAAHVERAVAAGALDVAEARPRALRSEPPRHRAEGRPHG